MTREEFITLSKDHILYLDGATGSNLVKAGMPSGVCPEQWILEHQDVMLQLQKDYVQAGTNILYAPTFTANRVKLAEYHLEKNMTSMIRDLVAISKKAAESTPGHPVYVAGDLTMTGEQLKPMGKMDLETLIDIYKEQILCLVDAGADLLVVETMMSLAETRAALIAAKEVCDLPVIATLTFEADGRTLFGTDAKTAAIVLESLGASAIGANCSTGPAQMESIISEMVSHTRIPVIAKPNAGLPFLDENGTTCYNMEAEEFAEEMEVLVNAGATILGGCCGTTPEFIRQIHERFGTDAKVAASRRPDGIRYLTSERITHSFGLDDGFFVVGERINPTGKKALQAQLREGSFEKVIQFAEEQEACGAKVLDINMGMSGIDEKASMLRALEEVSGVTNLPLSLDSSYVEVLEAALRNYPGRALVNSVSLETEKFEKLLPIVAKYGAMFILLPLSDAGLPKDIEEKKEIIHKIYDRALSLGMCKEDIVVDGLVATVGANPKAALETLETIRYCKENGFATICGLSNISFAMPERSFVNTAFLTLAIQAGLTMAIANPSQELLMSCALAADLLLNKEEAALRYIEYAGGVRERREEKEAELAKKLALLENQGTTAKTGTAGNAAKETTTDNGPQINEMQDKLKTAVLKGNRNGIVKITKEALESGEKPAELLNQVLLPAINQVGEFFDQGKYFLPQLIASAEAMKNSIEVLEPLLQTEGTGEEMPVVVIATVEGDIHDIGKNLVALMLKNHGFHVIDLGKDVPQAKILESAKEHHAEFIALSALMTTTMQRMREIVAAAKEEGITAKIIIGGAVITQEYADEIGADGYSKDAADAVKLAKSLM
ncbi:MAG TPA: 5-methyltetrahydrofolate--homocysteine methyltransferase [Lachnospiraceae bacterium]|uniref:homocysteine S-methyltransferase family protein n=1 Tax=Waltera sp. TaxID=2815806 RepID=UPI000E9BABB5|nr:5-methyltetrahydrofolate--homocysteine methyltransferase [Lachnospiraceae bacterium]HCK48325.1 5-methyltetrahydrofolate--homocysteine methyltransferase [Lachnospiraceae bacterium]